MERGRLHLTNLEEEVERFLNKRGIESIPQYPLRTGVVCDFLLPKENIIIEVDGERWHSSKKQKKKDMFKDYMLQREGWKVIRIKEKELKRDLENLLSYIKNER